MNLFVKREICLRLYESSKMFPNVEQSDKQSNVHIETEIKAETDAKTNSTVGKAKTVYLNGVLSNWIRDTKNPLFTDLTLMFGEGNEPSQKWCDKYLANYYEYNLIWSS